MAGRGRSKATRAVEGIPHKGTTLAADERFRAAGLEGVRWRGAPGDQLIARRSQRNSPGCGWQVPEDGWGSVGEAGNRRHWTTEQRRSA